MWNWGESRSPQTDDNDDNDDDGDDDEVVWEILLTWYMKLWQSDWKLLQLEGEILENRKKLRFQRCWKHAEKKKEDCVHGENCAFDTNKD